MMRANDEGPADSSHCAARPSPDERVIVDPRTLPQITVVVPPAASIFSLAEDENASTLTWTATEMSP
jgi:hypothetical protein